MRREWIIKIKPVYYSVCIYIYIYYIYLYRDLHIYIVLYKASSCCIDATCLKLITYKWHKQHPPPTPRNHNDSRLQHQGHDGLAVGLWSFSGCFSGTCTELSHQQLDLSLGHESKKWVWKIFSKKRANVVVWVVQGKWNARWFQIFFEFSFLFREDFHFD